MHLKMPVRIGASGADGLLQGGSYPVVGSIASNAHDQAGGYRVFRRAGYPVRVTDRAGGRDEHVARTVFFQQATLSFPYDMNNMETVLIMK